MYEYTLKFKPTTQHANADALSRLPLPETVTPPLSPETVPLLEFLNKSPVTADQIRIWTRRDPLLSKVTEYVQGHWPDTTEDGINPFKSRQLELSIQDGCILWGNQVVIPPQGRTQLLQELHECHPGVSRMKSLAQTFVWWPGLDKDIEQTVAHCTECQRNRPLPPTAPLHPWEWPSQPWSRIHMDFAGPIAGGHMLLIIVDVHSKWIEVHVMSSSTSSATIGNLRVTFAQLGIPRSIVTDNGPCFVSAEFKQFLSKNGITQITSAPYHPSSNGLAERAVQTVKQGIKKLHEGTLRDKVSRFLFAYRNTPQTTTGKSPAEMLFGHKLSTHLSLIKPDPSTKVLKEQQRQKHSHDSRATGRCLRKGDHVYARNYSIGPTWLPGIILKQTGPVSFVLKLERGYEWHRHADQLRKRLDTNNSTKNTPSKSEDTEFDFPVESVPCTTNTPPQSSTDISNDTSSLSEDNPSNVKASRRSNRN